jgi:aspartyl-tRNA(Asn)/glutamyl-tRNA(Gln) amidotransferase subunit B
MQKTIADFDIVIGLEVHIQLTTNSKLFNNDAANFGADANTNISAITLGHPGTLPRINEAALQQAIKLGLSLGCSINTINLFSRKHYLYPDLPKGFQTTQHVNPICDGGTLTIQLHNETKTINIHHIHLEEDAGKSIHDLSPNYTAIDYNRAGTPLCELVTEPCITNSDEAAAFLTALRKLVRWVGVSDGNMEEGSLRCDANVSIKPKGDTTLGTRVEVKNLNSIKFVKKAIDHEVQRMVAMVNNNQTIEQETRSFEANTETTFSLRSKEDAMDYRYIIEPDLAPVLITEHQINEYKAQLPELPHQLIQHLQQQHSLSNYDATLLVDDIEIYTYFEECLKHYPQAKPVANFINGPIKQYCNEANVTISATNITPLQIATTLQLVDDGVINFSIASGKLWQALLKNPTANPVELVAQLNLAQQTNSNDIEQWIATVVEKNTAKVQEYQKGKKGLIGFFMGEVVKLSKGKAEPKTTQALIVKALEKTN